MCSTESYRVVQSRSFYCVVRVHIKKNVACEIEWSVFKESQSISIGKCSSDLYMLYLFETSGTASCGYMLNILGKDKYLIYSNIQLIKYSKYI